MSDGAEHLESAADDALGREAARAREARAGCPPPDLVIAHSSEALPDEVRVRVEAHLRGCDACRALAADADSLEPGIPEGADARVFARIQPPRRNAPWVSWLLAASVLLACGVAAAWWLRPSSGRTAAVPPATPPAGPGPTTPAPVAMQAPLWSISAATVRVPLSALGASRGVDAGGARTRVLMAALAPYEKADFDAAIERLEAFVREYPDAADASFYLGVSYLMADRPADAVAPLSRARDARAERDRREVDWYLAAAEQRTGRTAEAAARVDRLCRTPGAYQQSACAAADKLR